MAKVGLPVVAKLAMASVSIFPLAVAFPAQGTQKAKVATVADTEKAMNCSKTLSSLKELTSTTQYEVGLVFNKPMKDQYEKQAAYEVRSRQAFQSHQQATAVKAQTLPGYKLVYPSGGSYDAEKEQFSISNPMYDIFFNTGIADQKLLSFTVADGGAQERSMGLGAKAKTSRWYGFALALKPKDSGLRRKYFNMKSSPASARSIGSDLGLAIAAKPVAPWVADNYTSSTDYGTLTQSNHSTRVVVAEVLCAAIINIKTLEVLQVIK